jgi:hypothetical protein
MGWWTCILDRCRWLRDIHVICDRFISETMRFIFCVYFILFILHFHIHFLWSCICAFFCIKTTIWQYKWLYFQNLKKHTCSTLTTGKVYTRSAWSWRCATSNIHTRSASALRVYMLLVAHAPITRSAPLACATGNIHTRSERAYALRVMYYHWRGSGSAWTCATGSNNRCATGSYFCSSVESAVAEVAVEISKGGSSQKRKERRAARVNGLGRW